MLDRLSHWLPHRLSGYTTRIAIQAITQWMQRRLARELVERLGINVIHQPIPVSPKQPSMISDVGAPVIIGPMNGGMCYPPKMRWLESYFEWAVIALGRGSAGVMNLLVPGKRRAALLLVANDRTAAALAPGVHAPVRQLVENGVDLSLWSAAHHSSGENAIRLAFVGRLIRLKAVDLLLEAVHRACIDVDVHLDVIGDGPERANLEALAARLGIANRMTFHGHVPQRKCPERLVAADALVLPSLHECGGAVVLEAMAMSMPVIATRWGGPADYLDDSCGVLIEPAGREPFVADLTDAIRKLAASPALRQSLGEAGRRKVEAEYDWDRKIDHMLQIYLDVVTSAVTGSAASGA
jgi:glycosyltransferase involved in cell wall biosynthesis